MAQTSPEQDVFRTSQRVTWGHLRLIFGDNHAVISAQMCRLQTDNYSSDNDLDAWRLQVTVDILSMTILEVEELTQSIPLKAQCSH